MPFVNGVGFLYRLRQLPPLRDVPVMVITGASVDDETLADLRDLHASLRFKPLALTDLLDETRTLVAAQNTSLSSMVLKEAGENVNRRRLRERRPAGRHDWRADAHESFIAQVPSLQSRQTHSKYRRRASGSNGLRNTGMRP